jgi:hypothetical protein
MKPFTIITSALILTLVSGSFPPTASAETPARLKGRILLQVEDKGQAWYVDPLSGQRVSLGRPPDAFAVMRSFGLGISNENLAKIPKEGESGSSKNAAKLSGRILLQVESRGEAWYVYPGDLKRYYLGTPGDAFAVMRKLGLGVTNDVLGSIPIYSEQSAPNNKKSTAPTPKNTSDLSGTYRCWSYNVSGSGGSCAFTPPLVLRKDKSYSMSSEKGTWSVSGNTVTLSESKIRGKGTVIDGEKIRFEYDYNAQHHTITYLKNSEVSTNVSSGSIVTLDLAIDYTYPDPWLDWINVVTLIPEGVDPATTDYKPRAIAVSYDQKRITAYFKPIVELKSGSLYDVYVSSGLDEQKIGTIDMRNTRGEVKKTLIVKNVDQNAPTEQGIVQSPEPSLSTPEPSPTPVQSNPTETPVTPCDSSIPHYAGGC